MLFTVHILGASSYETRRANDTASILVLAPHMTLCITCRYLSCKADGDSSMIFDASLSAFEARISPSAAITLARASRDASASAAIARWSCSGNRASLLKKEF